MDSDRGRPRRGGPRTAMELALKGGKPVRTDPFPSWPVYGPEEEEMLLQVLRSGSWGGYNRKVEEFETAFAALHQVRYGVSCANGTVALEVALRSLDIRCGDEVILAAITFVATASTVLLCQATPVFVDIDPVTLNISAQCVEAALTPRTKAIVAVHFGGQPADVDALRDIAGRHHLALIEDAAHAHGASWRGTPAGNVGDAATFSFQMFKLVTSGEGGIIVTNVDGLAEKAWACCNHGRRREAGWYEHFTLGTNYRLTGFQAAVLIAQLAKLLGQTQTRRANVAHLRNLLRSFKGLRLEEDDPRVTNNPYYLVTLRFDPGEFGGLDRDLFLQALVGEGVPAQPTYPLPLYRNPLFRTANLSSRVCSGWKGSQDYESLYLRESERLCRDGIWLEQNLFLGTTRDVENIVEACLKIQKMTGKLTRLHPLGG
jgi:dTDP-4-amino-4,6-dideoxygalactose transaminase